MRVRVPSDVRAIFATAVVAFPLFGCTDATSPNQSTLHRSPAIRISVKVVGVFPSDPFQIQVDNRSATPVPVAGIVVVKGLSAGMHTVSLVALPSACRINGDNKATVETSLATVSNVEFRVSCFPAGAVAVAPTVSGLDFPLWFAASVDGGAKTPVKANATTILGDSFPAGVHVVHLSTISPRCNFAGERTASVNVSTGGLAKDTAVASFNYTCNSPEPGVSGVISGTLVDSATQGKLIDVAAPVISATPLDGGAPIPVFVSLASATSFTLGGMSPGRWNLSISVVHWWSGVFNNLKLYRDTSVTVDVVAGETTVIPPILLRPRPLMLLIGIHTCPFPLPDPPSMEDWSNDECEGGFWGGANVEIDVAGVEGTATAGEHFHGKIGDTAYVGLERKWEEAAWSTFFDIAIPGDYDVKVINATPSGFTNPIASLRLVPWENSATRVTASNGLAYLGLDFWVH